MALTIPTVQMEKLRPNCLSRGTTGSWGSQAGAQGRFPCAALPLPHRWDVRIKNGRRVFNCVEPAEFAHIMTAVFSRQPPHHCRSHRGWGPRQGWAGTTQLWRTAHEGGHLIGIFPPQQNGRSSFWPFPRSSHDSEEGPLRREEASKGRRPDKMRRVESIRLHQPPPSVGLGFFPKVIVDFFSWFLFLK